MPAVFTLLLQERDLIESLDFTSLVSLKIGSAPTPKELLDAVEAAFGVPVGESEVMPLLLEAGFVAGPRRAVLRP